MDDSKIIDLYWRWDERAIAETDSKYGAYCRAVSMNILGVREDAEECVSDTYARAWNAMPPERPGRLRAWLAGITRNLSIDRWRRNTAEKRGGGEAQLLLDELEECVSGSESPETELLRKELRAALNRFLRGLPERERAVFLFRYYHALTKEEIAQKMGLSSNQVKYILQRTRKKLADMLQKEGFQ